MTVWRGERSLATLALALARHRPRQEALQNAQQMDGLRPATTHNAGTPPPPLPSSASLQRMFTMSILRKQWLARIFPAFLLFLVGQQ